jgi:hypothetical protein
MHGTRGCASLACIACSTCVLAWHLKDVTVIPAWGVHFGVFYAAVYAIPPILTAGVTVTYTVCYTAAAEPCLTSIRKQPTIQWMAVGNYLATNMSVVRDCSGLYHIL